MRELVSVHIRTILRVTEKVMESKRRIILPSLNMLELQNYVYHSRDIVAEQLTLFQMSMAE